MILHSSSVISSIDLLLSCLEETQSNHKMGALRNGLNFGWAMESTCRKKIK